MIPPGYASSSDEIPVVHRLPFSMAISKGIWRFRFPWLAPSGQRVTISPNKSYPPSTGGVDRAAIWIGKSPFESRCWSWSKFRLIARCVKARGKSIAHRHVCTIGCGVDNALGEGQAACATSYSEIKCDYHIRKDNSYGALANNNRK